MKYIVPTLLILAIMVGVIECYATVITPPTTIQLDGGSESNGIWKGGYWVFTIAVDQADSIVGNVVLPQNTTENFDNGTKILTSSKVEIQLTPTRAYYKRALKLMDINDRIVAPAVYSGGINMWGWAGSDLNQAINPTVVNTYTWADQGWTKYTVFNATVIVDGKIVGQTSFNTEAGMKDLEVPTTNGTVLLKNVGCFAPDVTEPQVPTDIVIFDRRYMYSGDALRYIRYDHGRTVHYWLADNCLAYYMQDTEAFSTYWWGYVRWNPNGPNPDCIKDTPAPYKYAGDGVFGGYTIADPAKGWKADDYTGGWRRRPVAPAIYPENGTDSLIEYLNRKTAEGNIAKTFLSNYDWSLDYDQNGQPISVTVNLPWGAYSGAPVVTCYVPSELASTWVYQPPIANVKVLKAYWDNTSDIVTNATCTLVVCQNSTVTSSFNIYAEAGERAKISPWTSTETLKPNETMELHFNVENLGVTEDTQGTVKFSVRRSWDNIETDNTILTYTLKKPVMPKNASDIPNRPNDVDGKGTPTVPEYHFPVLELVALMGGILIAIVAIVAVYKSKAIKKEDAKSTLTAFGNLGKAGAKEGLKIGKWLWKSSKTLRRLGGCFVGGLIVLMAYYSGNFFGAVGLGPIAIPGAVFVGGLGALLFTVCFVSIFK